MRVFKARDRDQRGAVLVEMAIVIPIFVLLVFGMLEFGLAFKNKLTFSHAASQAARRATVVGNDGAADLEILEAFAEGLVGAADIDLVDHVDIFLVNADGSKGDYDRYRPDNVSIPGCGWDPCPDPDIVSPVTYGSPDDYPPCERDVYLDASDGVDTIGIEVQYQHNWVTGVLGFSSATWSETARSRMEPDLFGSDSTTC